MALKSETKTIDGITFEVTQLPYTRGHKVLLRLFRALAPAVAEALGQAPELKERELGSLDIRDVKPALAAAVGRLVQDLSEEDFDFVNDELASHSFVLQDGKKLKLQSEREFLFAGNYWLMFQWLAFAVKVNFLGFLNGESAIAEALARVGQAPKASPSRTG